jgi:hypothetical protein
VYTCEAYNSHGMATLHLTLEVVYPPSCTITKEVTVKKGYNEEKKPYSFLSSSFSACISIVQATYLLLKPMTSNTTDPVYMYL